MQGTTNLVDKKIYGGVIDGTSPIPNDSTFEISIPVYGNTIVLTPQYYGPAGAINYIIRNKGAKNWTIRLKSTMNSQIDAGTWWLHWIQIV